MAVAEPVAAILGVLVAVAAFIFSIVHTGRARRDMARERRLEFELQLLAETRRVLTNERSTAGVAGYVGALVRDESSDELQLLRAAIGIRSNKAGRTAFDELERNKTDEATLLSQYEREVDIAIQRRLPSLEMTKE